MNGLAKIVIGTPIAVLSGGHLPGLHEINHVINNTQSERTCKMQRFYCTECKKIKRVQKLPANVENPTSIDPTDRIGKCNRHNPLKPVKVLQGIWSEANTQQAEGRMNRTNVRKVR